MIHIDLVNGHFADDRVGVLGDGPEDAVPCLGSQLAAAGDDILFHKPAIGNAPGNGRPLPPLFFEFDLHIPGLCRRPGIGTPAKGLPHPSTVVIVDAVDETVFFGMDRHWIVDCCRPAIGFAFRRGGRDC